MRFMPAFNSKFLPYTIFIGLVTFIISMVCYATAYSKDIRNMNYTNTVPIENYTLPINVNTSLGVESQNNSLASEGINFTQQYQEVNDQEFGQTNTFINQSFIEETTEMFQDNFTEAGYNQIDDMQDTGDNFINLTKKIDKRKNVLKNLLPLYNYEEVRKKNYGHKTSV